jgi:hypothetical protein
VRDALIATVTAEAMYVYKEDKRVDRRLKRSVIALTVSIRRLMRSVRNERQRYDKKVCGASK